MGIIKGLLGGLVKSYWCLIAVLLGWSDINPEAERALLDRLVESGTFIVGIGPMPTTKATEERVATLDGFLESAPPLPADLRFKRFFQTVGQPGEEINTGSGLDLVDAHSVGAQIGA